MDYGVSPDRPVALAVTSALAVIDEEKSHDTPR